MDSSGPVGAVAQLGERLVRNEEVSGSIPLSSTIHTQSQIHILAILHMRRCPARCSDIEAFVYLMHFFRQSPVSLTLCEQNPLMLRVTIPV